MIFQIEFLTSAPFPSQSKGAHVAVVGFYRVGALTDPSQVVVVLVYGEQGRKTQNR
jgi:hypothetical protein